MKTVEVVIHIRKGFMCWPETILIACPDETIATTLELSDITGVDVKVREVVDSVKTLFKS